MPSGAGSQFDSLSLPGESFLNIKGHRAIRIRLHCRQHRRVDQAYGSSKFAVVGLAQCLRYELKPRGISVACFCPGEVETPGLAAERKTLHPASAALKKIGGSMPVEAAVRGLVKGIEHDEAMIIPGWKVKFTYWMHRITPDRLWNAITDAIVAKAMREST